MATTAEETLGSENGWHRVCLNTIVRKGEELDSERLRILPMGSRVKVEQVKGRRVRISAPIAGWCSKRSSSDDTILEKIQNPNEGGVTPSNRNPVQKMGILQKKIDAENDDEKVKKLQQELDDLKNVIKEKDKQQQTLQALLTDVRGSKSQNIRVSDCVKLPKGKGLGVVKWVGKLPEEPQTMIGVQVELGHGDSNGYPVEGDKTIGWFAGEKGAIFIATEKVKLLTGESMLSELVNLIALKNYTEQFIAGLGEEALEKFYKDMD